MYLRSEAAAKMFPSNEELSIAATPPELQEVGFTLLGVYFAVEAFARIAGLIYTAMQKEAWQDESRLEYAWAMNREGLVAAPVELVAGLALILGARRLARITRA